MRLRDIPPYILPAPSLIAATLVKDWPILSGSLLVTLRTTLVALGLAVVGSVGLAILFAQSKLIERSFFPFAVVLQVTPVVSIAPLLLIYLEPGSAVLVCAFLVAFFPILSNTALGLASADHNLIELMELYRASRWQQLVRLRLPSALPYFLGGLQDRRRPGADRRHRGRDRGRVRRAGVRAGVPHRRSGVSPQHSPHVRGAGADLAYRHPDLRRLHDP